jgi:hypothetical protein
VDRVGSPDAKVILVREDIQENQVRLVRLASVVLVENKVVKVMMDQKVILVNQVH